MTIRHAMQLPIASFVFIALPFLATTLPAAPPAAPLTLHPEAQPLPTKLMGPFVSLKDGGILAIEKSTAVISHDEGQTWAEPIPLFTPEQNLAVSNERALLRTKEGAIVLAFMNTADRRWKWNEQENRADGDVWLRTWAVRSLDEGRTWQDAVQIQDHYCGCVRDLKQSSAGNLVVTVQRLLPEFARHATVTYSSTDQGTTWQGSNILDLGGRGHHDGSIESTTVELKDGRMWLLLRTNHDRFWQAFSNNHGAVWQTFGPTEIEASSSPGMIVRLASGRLALAWNRLYPVGADTYARKAGNWSATPASYHREELSIAFSKDDGQTWTTPVVLAKQANAWLSYPHIYERRPGELWITTMQGEVRVKVQEADLLAK